MKSLPSLELFVYCPFNDSSIASSLGQADYSYYFVLKRFRPALARFGPVRELQDLSGLATASEEARHHGRFPILLLFAPPHSAPVESPCPVIPVFAWEFDTIPDEHWDDEPRHDWVRVLGASPGAITHSEYAVAAVKRSLGSDYPIICAPAPVWDRFTGLTDVRWTGEPRNLRFSGTVLDSAKPNSIHGASLPDPLFETAEQSVTILGPTYTTVLNPQDGRKNHRDVLTAFVWAFHDNPDATLVVKLVHSDRDLACLLLLRELQQLPRHRCRIVVIQGFLEQEQFDELLRATTFVVNASHAEGQCLPLMEFMSAGKPAIAPQNTAMADYVAADNALILHSTPEWTGWPQDPRLLLRCVKYRIDWESLVDAFQASWRIATANPARYETMAAAAGEAQRTYCSGEVVVARISELLAGVVLPNGSGYARHTAATGKEWALAEPE